MQRSLTKGPITGSILLFALPMMLAYLLSATPLGVQCLISRKVFVK